MISGENHLILFSVDPFHCALPVPNVQEIIRMVGIQPIPGTREDLEGTINLRGRMVPVVDLRKRFGVEDPPYEVRTRILIIGFGGKPLGLIVDDVLNVVEVAAEEKSFDLTEWAGATEIAPVARVIKVDGVAYAVLDLRRLFEVHAPNPSPTEVPRESQSTHRG